MLTLKVSSLSYKCVFYRTESNTKGGPLNFEGLEMQKCKTPTNSAQRVDETNVIICLVIMFAPRIMVIKMSKTAHFLYFLLMLTEKLLKFRRKYLRVYLRDLI